MVSIPTPRPCDTAKPMVLSSSEPRPVIPIWISRKRDTRTMSLACLPQTQTSNHKSSLTRLWKPNAMTGHCLPSSKACRSSRRGRGVCSWNGAVSRKCKTTLHFSFPKRRRLYSLPGLPWTLPMSLNLLACLLQQALLPLRKLPLGKSPFQLLLRLQSNRGCLMLQRIPFSLRRMALQLLVAHSSLRRLRLHLQQPRIHF